MNSYHYFKSNPLGFRNNQLNNLGFKKNQNKQVEKLFWVHLIFCHSIEILEQIIRNHQLPWDLKRTKPFLSTDQIPWDLERTNKITWDLKRTKTNIKENCFVFILFSVIRLLRKKNQIPWDLKEPNHFFSPIMMWSYHQIKRKQYEHVS